MGNLATIQKKTKLIQEKLFCVSSLIDWSKDFIVTAIINFTI